MILRFYYNWSIVLFILHLLRDLCCLTPTFVAVPSNMIWKHGREEQARSLIVVESVVLVDKSFKFDERESGNT